MSKLGLPAAERIQPSVAGRCRVGRLERSANALSAWETRRADNAVALPAGQGVGGCVASVTPLATSNDEEHAR